MLHYSLCNIFAHSYIEIAIYCTSYHVYKEHLTNLIIEPFPFDPDWIRTNDPPALPTGRQVRRLVLYPAELPGR